MRLDKRLVELGCFETTARANDAVKRGMVMVNGIKAKKAGQQVIDTDDIDVDDPAADYVSRSALKLKHGFDIFGFSPQNQIIIDVGASTGGFTQVCLEYGADQLIALDVGRDQLHPKLCEDTRVYVLNGVNARHMSLDMFPITPTSLVMDVSFISIRLILENCLACLDFNNESFAIVLLKPQFEVGRDKIGKGGIVNDDDAQQIVLEMTNWLMTSLQNWQLVGISPSPIIGSDGNQEFLIGLRYTQKSHTSKI